MIRHFSTPRLCPSRHPGTRLLAAAFALLLLACLPIASRADVFGRLRVIVRDEAGSPVPSANVIFHDTAGVRPDFNVRSTAQGIALSPLLEIRSWQVTVKVVTFDDDTRTLPVVADTSTDVEVLLIKRVVSRTSAGVTLNRGTTTSSTRRDRAFIQHIPATGANPQSLPRILTTNPGFVPSSVNVVHPRGERAVRRVREQVLVDAARAAVDHQHVHRVDGVGQH